MKTIMIDKLKVKKPETIQPGDELVIKDVDGVLTAELAMGRHLDAVAVANKGHRKVLARVVSGGRYE